MPSVIEIQPLLTTSLIRARRSVTSSLMLIGGFSAGGSAPSARAASRAEATFAAAPPPQQRAEHPVEPVTDGLGRPLARHDRDEGRQDRRGR